ncbi:hypothetical protein BDY19DRAFT_987261 [Irpex rosettiformis]|uniref:Uncharacterized protein n=1 Tax=Irpex rosettiformis TaxID=378272 RepID=A0ACB8TSK8_9APHY|nr:hypothetical protein BDY19DRAFT_987261 [Irpex rosettiformis]
MPNSRLNPPSDPKSLDISESLVAKPLPDGYWVQAFPYSHKHKHPDLIGYGLGFQSTPSTIRVFNNPLNESGSAGWKVSGVASLEFPVAMDYADLTGDGYNDIIICDRYGPNMDNLWESGSDKDGGRVQWLRNPGDRTSQSFWKAQKIGNSTACHFTTASVVQVLAFPIIPKSSDLTSPAPVIVFTPEYADIKDKSPGPKTWKSHNAYPDHFRMIHDVKVLPKANGELDMLLVSGKEGVVLLWYDVPKDKYEYNIVGTGIPNPEDGVTKYWGAGSVDVCRVGDDDIGYISTCEAFHGNIVAVYTKSEDAPKGVESLKDAAYWTRYVIDDYGPLDHESQTGTLHHVATVRFPETKEDYFAVACLGAPTGKRKSIHTANQGVYMYKPTDLKKVLFEKIKVTGESAGRLAVASFCAEHHLGIASISYYVPGYHTGPDAPSLRFNDLRTGGTAITATKLDKEVLLRIPRPSALAPGQATPTFPFWDLAGKRLGLVVLGPRATTKLNPEVGAVKVIYGNLTILDPHSGQSEIRGVAPAAHTHHTTVIAPFAKITAGEHGTVFMSVQILDNHSQGPFTTMSQVVTENSLPRREGVSDEARDVKIPFIRVDRTNWGMEGGLWNDFQFFNATGYHVYFNDDAMEKVVHIQAWTLGLGETVLLSFVLQSFCEIHYCLTNGGGTAGMRYFPDDYTAPIDVKKELTKEYVHKNSTLLVVPPMHEHGPLWRIKRGTKATPIIRDNDTVSYPWHAWLASEFGEYKLPIEPPIVEAKQRFDVWMAFEFPSSSFQY